MIVDFRELYIAELKAVGFSAADAVEIADWYCASASMSTFPAHCRRVALAPDGYDPNQPRNADGEWTSGGPSRGRQPDAAVGRARPREPETKPQHDRYGSTDEKTLASNPRKNYARGDAALSALLNDRKGAIDKAMYRYESGWIRFDWGDPGDPGKDYKHGHGISHIKAKHEKDLKKLVGTIANGAAKSDPSDPTKTIFVTDTAYAIVVPFNQTQRKMLTMFEPRPDSAALAAIKKYPPAPKRQGR